MNYYGISHVTLVFFTRTLSNSFEAFLFLALIYLVIRNVLSLLSIPNENKSDQNLVQSSSTTIRIDRHIILTSSLIGFICALGIFNRPTYPAFAIVPILYWFINIISTIHLYVLISQVISYIVGTFLITSSVLILFDSYYYNDGFSFMIDWKNRLVVCPLNFILYNIDSTNLDKHGLHPPWLHFTVNANILYGPMHLCVVLWSLFHISSIKHFGQSIINQVLKLFHTRSIKIGQLGI
jgi:phosphatidylinositol glycan class Z